MQSKFIDREYLTDKYGWESIHIDGYVDGLNFNRVGVGEYNINTEDASINNIKISVMMNNNREVPFVEASKAVCASKIHPIFSIEINGKKFTGEAINMSAGKHKFTFEGILIEEVSQKKRKSLFKRILNRIN